jgi:hypothetical protein
LHSAAVLRLTGTERAVAELAAVAEHVASLTAASAAFQLQPDVPTETRTSAPLIPLVDDSSSGPTAEILAEIRGWARTALGVERVPAIWRALANHPRLLEATWRKDRLILDAGALDPLVKGCAALAVAQFRQSSYWIAYLTQYLRQTCSLDDRGLVEVAGGVMHYVSFNTIAHGMRLEPPMAEMTAADVAPGGRLEHHLPGARRVPKRSAGAST